MQFIYRFKGLKGNDRNYGNFVNYQGIIKKLMRNFWEIAVRELIKIIRNCQEIVEELPKIVQIAEEIPRNFKRIAKESTNNFKGIAGIR